MMAYTYHKAHQITKKYEIVFYRFTVCSFKAHKRCVEEAALEASMVYRKPYDFGPELLISTAVVKVSRESGEVKAVDNTTTLPSTSSAVTTVDGVTDQLSTSTVVSAVNDTTASLPDTDEITMNDIKTSCYDAVEEMKQTTASPAPDVTDSMGQLDSNVETEEINRFGSKHQWLKFFRIWSRRFIFCFFIFMC